MVGVWGIRGKWKVVWTTTTTAGKPHRMQMQRRWWEILPKFSSNNNKCQTHVGPTHMHKCCPSWLELAFGSFNP